MFTKPFTSSEGIPVVCRKAMINHYNQHESLPATHSSSYRCLNWADTLLRNIKETNKPFGGISVLFSGDFRQTLPIQKFANRATTVNLCCFNANCWKAVTFIKLSKNLRLMNGNDLDALRLLEIGETSSESIDQKVNLSFATFVDSIENLIEYVFREGVVNAAGSAILAPTNLQVNIINSIVLNNMVGERIVLLGENELATAEGDTLNISSELLGALEVQGLPSNRLELKIGAPIILVRTIQSPILVNVTGAKLLEITPTLLKIEITSGVYSKRVEYLPKVRLSSNLSAIKFYRKQFPIKGMFLKITIVKERITTVYNNYSKMYKSVFLKMSMVVYMLCFSYYYSKTAKIYP